MTLYLNGFKTYYNDSKNSSMKINHLKFIIIWKYQNNLNRFVSINLRFLAQNASIQIEFESLYSVLSYCVKTLKIRL